MVCLQINDHVKSSVVIAGPFHHSATGAQCLWDTLKKPYKEHSIIPKTLPLDHPLDPYGLIMSEIFLREDHKDEEKDGVLNSRLLGSMSPTDLLWTQSKLRKGKS
jgi:hypothetical protein